MVSIIDETTLNISHDDKEYTCELYKVDDLKLFPNFDIFRKFIQTKIDENDYTINKNGFNLSFQTKYEFKQINLNLKENKYMKKIKNLEIKIDNMNELKKIQK